MSTEELRETYARLLHQFDVERDTVSSPDDHPSYEWDEVLDEDDRNEYRAAALKLLAVRDAELARLHEEVKRLRAGADGLYLTSERQRAAAADLVERAEAAEAELARLQERLTQVRRALTNLNLAADMRVLRALHVLDTATPTDGSKPNA